MNSVTSPVVQVVAYVDKKLEYTEGNGRGREREVGNSISTRDMHALCAHAATDKLGQQVRQSAPTTCAFQHFPHLGSLNTHTRINMFRPTL